ncbi:hypothetical protein L3Y34_001040 [Caenorhabditis briggsae]|uniref:Uncharacterized protein n=1 Tax=Caenorhabditis briggsae TaxID=6238 RepID=A0AAE9DB80_CAEBR|nr:hypothetical protein L3Y34_001040 [Caenorhabditis briggsae]
MDWMCVHHQQLRRRTFFGNTNEQMHKTIGKFLKRWMYGLNNVEMSRKFSMYQMSGIVECIERALISRSSVGEPILES